MVSGSILQLGILVSIIAIASGCATTQQKLLYHPTHHHNTNGLGEWRHENKLIGYAHEVSSPQNIWLLLHGNGGQASDRICALNSFSPRDSVYILEYPGYGMREGSPSLSTLNGAARQAYESLRAQFPNTPICVAGESIGSGPSCSLASLPQPPDTIVLIVPFDVLSKVASEHFPLLPARLLLRDNWDNVETVQHYTGPVEIFGARDDKVIPIHRAKALAQSLPGAVFHEIPGGHNEWSASNRVSIRNGRTTD